MKDTESCVKDAVEPFVQALAPLQRVELCQALVQAIIQDAVLIDADQPAKHALMVDQRTGNVLFFDVSKAILAAVRVLTSFAALIASPSLAAISAVLATLASLQGIQTSLPHAQAVICLLLSQIEDRSASSDELLAAFNAYIEKHPDEDLSSTQFNGALSALRDIQCIELKDKLLKFGQIIAVRR